MISHFLSVKTWLLPIFFKNTSQKTKISKCWVRKLKYFKSSLLLPWKFIKKHWSDLKNWQDRYTMTTGYVILIIHWNQTSTTITSSKYPWINGETLGQQTGPVLTWKRKATLVIIKEVFSCNIDTHQKCYSKPCSLRHRRRRGLWKGWGKGGKVRWARLWVPYQSSIQELLISPYHQRHQRELTRSV